MAFKKKSSGRGMSKLQRSNAAHERISNKNGYGYVQGDYDSTVKYRYHRDVIYEQSKLKRVLSKNEKKSIYSDAKDKASSCVRKF